MIIRERWSDQIFVIKEIEFILFTYNGSSFSFFFFFLKIASKRHTEIFTSEMMFGILSKKKKKTQGRG